MMYTSEYETNQSLQSEKDVNNHWALLKCLEHAVIFLFNIMHDLE